MAEGGDSVDSGRKTSGNWENEIPDVSSLYLGSDGMEPLLCRMHGQEFKHFCTTHMTELCITCRRMEHKQCETVISIEDAAENIYSQFHGEKIGQSAKDLKERFNDVKGVVESLQAKLPNIRKIAVDQMLKARKDLDIYLDKLVANAIDELDQYLKTNKDTLEEKQDVCTASFSSLNTGAAEFGRIMSVGNKAEKFIAINRTTKQTQQYCKVLLDMYREMSEIKVKFEPNVAMTKIFQSLGTVSVETSRVTNVFSEMKPIYTGEMKLKSTHGSEPGITCYEMLPSGRKLVLDAMTDKIQLYKNNNIFITETIVPIKEGENCINLILNNNTEALVSTDDGRVFKVKIDDVFTVSEIKTKLKIYPMTKYGKYIMCALLKNDQWQLCVIDKNMKKIIKTILKDDGTLFSAPGFLGVSDDKNTVYVLDVEKGCYGITLDSQVVFHYQNLEVEHYVGLVVDSDGLFIACGDDNKSQVEKLNFSGERQEVCIMFGYSLPLKLVENELVLFQNDSNNIEYYCL